MNRRVLAVAALATALVAAPSVASAQSPLKFGLAAGATLPQGDAGDVFGTGFHVAGHLAIKPVAMPFGVRGEIMYHTLGEKDPANVGANVIAGLVNAEFSLPGAGIKPYFIGGLGMYRIDVDVDGFEAETDFGYNVGAGLNFALAGFSTFAEIRYHSIQTEGDATNVLPISFGIRF